MLKNASRIFIEFLPVNRATIFIKKPLPNIQVYVAGLGSRAPWIVMLIPIFQSPHTMIPFLEPIAYHYIHFRNCVYIWQNEHPFGKLGRFRL